MTAWVRSALWAYAQLWAATLAGATAGRLAGGGATRDRADGEGIGLFADVMATNARLLAALVLAAALAQAVRAWRAALDAAVAVVVGFNALAVGAAIGAGGPAVARSVPHLPLEWAALAAGLALYASARRRLLCRAEWLGGSAVAIGLLVLAAGVEAWAPMIG